MTHCCDAIHLRGRRTVASAAALIAACLLAAGCGSGAPSRPATPPSPRASGVAFSECMRAHGLATFPDPGATGASNSIGDVAIPPTIDTRSPAFQNALRGCQPVLFPRGRPVVSAATKAAMIGQAQCMRTHGVPTFPDPTFPAGGGIIVTDAGTDPQSPAYQHAQELCGGS